MNDATPSSNRQGMSLVECLRSHDPEVDPDCHEAANEIGRLRSAINTAAAWIRTASLGHGYRAELQPLMAIADCSSHETRDSVLADIDAGCAKALQFPMSTPVAEVLGNIRELIKRHTSSEKAEPRREYHANGTYWSGVPTVDMPCDFCYRAITEHDPRTHACKAENGSSQS